MAIAADRLIVICAFRYALGRMSYLPSHVANWLIKNASEISDDDKKAIVREIDEAADGRGGLGMECDARTWMKVRDHFCKEAADGK